MNLDLPSREDYWLSTRMFSKVFCIQGDSWVTYSCTFIFQGDLLSEAIKTISIEKVGWKWKSIIIFDFVTLYPFPINTVFAKTFFPN